MASRPCPCYTADMKRPVVIISLPFNSRESTDYYHGFMHFVVENAVEWDIHCLRYPDESCLDLELRRLRPDAIVCSIEAHDGLSRPSLSYPKKLLSYARRHRTPFVGLNLTLSPAKYRQGERFFLLKLDSRPLGEMAADALLKAGPHRAYGYLCRPRPAVWSKERYAGFEEAVARAGGRRISVCHADYDDADMLSEWLASLPKPAAIFAENDYLARFLLSICADRGFRVPDEYSVIGVDDDPLLCRHTTPSLSSVHPDFPAVGYAAAKLIGEMLAGMTPSPPDNIRGTPTVTERTSTAPASPAGLLVRRAEELIAEQACNDIDAEKIAGRLGVSRRLLDLRFRQHTGTTVRVAIERVRLQRVRMLLTTTRLSLSEIAADCRFSSLSYLERVFHSVEGRTLQSYRNAAREHARNSSRADRSAVRSENKTAPSRNYPSPTPRSSKLRDVPSQAP